MDPEACLGILSRAHAAAKGSEADGHCCAGAPNEAHSHGYPAQVQKVERVADAMGCGQVLDVESGENQTRNVAKIIKYL